MKTLFTHVAALLVLLATATTAVRAQQPMPELATLLPTDLAAQPTALPVVEEEARPLAFHWTAWAAIVTPDAGPTAVPVLLTDLRVRRPAYDAPGVILYWTTAAEQCNAGFVIERRIEGDTTFRRVAQVPGQGTSVAAHSYAFVDDANQEPLTTYYRLRQLDSDGGRSTYSPELAVVGLPIGLPLPEAESTAQLLSPCATEPAGDLATAAR